MHTARSSSRPGGVSTRYPPGQGTPPDQAGPQDQAPPGTRYKAPWDQAHPPVNRM